MAAWIEPTRIKLYHAKDPASRPGPQNRCGPLIPPDCELAKEQTPSRKARARKQMWRDGGPEMLSRAGSFGHKKRERVRAADLPDRYCEACGKQLELKVYPSGKKETPSKFLVRRTCNPACRATLPRKRRSRRLISAAGFVLQMVQPPSPL